MPVIVAIQTLDRFLELLAELTDPLRVWDTRGERSRETGSDLATQFVERM